MDGLSERRAVWRRKAAKKGAIVPAYFEVTPRAALIVCGKCRGRFRRNLVPHVDEPTFICPNRGCGARNWLPVTYELR